MKQKSRDKFVVEKKDLVHKHGKDQRVSEEVKS